LDKVSSILSSGHYKTKEDIYRKVFNDDELQTLGYEMNKTATSNQSKSKKKNEGAKQENKTTNNEDGFFLTQGNNINNANNNEVNEN
jgi:hypothetical protein